MYYTVDAQSVSASIQSRYGADTVPDTMGMAAMGMAAGPPMRTTTTPTPHRQATTSPRRHRCNRAPPAEPCVISRPRAALGCVGGGDRPGWARVGVENVIGGVRDGHGRHCATGIECIYRFLQGSRYVRYVLYECIRSHSRYGEYVSCM